jgi:hypothetical protein
MPAGPKGDATPLAVVTGASSGIGAAVAERLARRGCRTLLIARRRDRIEELADRLRAHADSLPLSLDLADLDAIGPSLAEALDGRGPAAILVNNAGYGLLSPFVETSMQQHERLMRVNHLSAVRLIDVVLPDMLRAGRGHIINVSSIAARVGPWGHTGYAAAKAALLALSHGLAAECAGTGVHVSGVCPGVIDTEFFDEPSFASLAGEVRRRSRSTDYAARRIVGLLDRPRVELTLPPHYRAVDWLRALSPTYLNRWVAQRARPPQR